jgi:hypothetical protein
MQGGQQVELEGGSEVTGACVGAAAGGGDWLGLVLGS